MLLLQYFTNYCSILQEAISEQYPRVPNTATNKGIKFTFFPLNPLLKTSLEEKVNFNFDV